MPGRLLPLRNRWYEWTDLPSNGVKVTVHFALDDDAHYRVDELRVTGSVTNESLRAVPIGRIEAVANAQLGSWAPLPPDVLTHARQVVAELRPAEPGGSWEVPADPQVVRKASPDLPPRVEGGGRGKPDTFYREVAALYQSFAAETHRPAAALAESRGIPVTTAHRWVREARRRGFLPPGRQGKVG